MYKWKSPITRFPDIGDTILVKTISGQIFYAVYSAYDEFDVHRPDSDKTYRKQWYKYSSRTVLKWRYFKPNL